LARTAKFHRTSHLGLLQRKQRHLFTPSSDPTPIAKMGRMHSNGKGISSSALPYSRTAPAWLKTTPDAVVDQICKLAKKGATPSQIGVVLRDSHGIAQVKIVTGMSSITGLKRGIG
jgi:small subunit ribosomal protein S13e